MDKETQQYANLKLLQEAFALSPTTVVTFFEIDISDIISSLNVDYDGGRILRLHNTPIFGGKSIIWRGLEYIAAPIRAEGFEVRSSGPPPTPKISIYIGDNDVPEFLAFRQFLRKVGDITGAKVTRIRTFAKFLDAANFGDAPPNGFEPDQNVEFPRDYYYIERKSSENRSGIEFELSAFFDVENIKLPGRKVLQSKCSCVYRGNGCLYEYATRRNISQHGSEQESSLPTVAPAVATYKDEKIDDILPGIPIVDRGEYNTTQTYKPGHQVYIERNGIKYYFVARIDNPRHAPPFTSEWIADECSKSIYGCELRWGKIGNGALMFNGFPSVNKSI